MASLELHHVFDRALRYEYIHGMVGPLLPEARHEWMVRQHVFIGQYGPGRIRVEFHDGEVVETPAGGGVVIPPGLSARAWVLEPGMARWTMAAITLFDSVDVCAFFNLPRVFGPNPGQRLGVINADLVALAREPASIQGAIRRQRLGYELVDRLLERAEPKSGISGLMHSVQRLQPALQVINENLTRPITVADMARPVHVSPARFHVLFKQAFGMSPIRFHQHERMKKAQAMLLRTGLSVKEIAAAAGYEDPLYFSRVFRNHVQISPGRFRQMMLRGMPNNGSSPVK